MGALQILITLDCVLNPKNPNPNLTVTPHFWIYWTVAAPLIITILSYWAL